MQIIADLHLHSRFSRAVSQKMNTAEMSSWAKIKGLTLLGTGDFTHPLWFRELASDLVETGNGFLKAKAADGPLFCLTTEIASIYQDQGRLRRVHSLIFLPSLASVEKFNQLLKDRNVNLLSDGRPITRLSPKNLLELALEADDQALFVPAHIWTPWFSLYGANSGYDSLKECFGDLSHHIFAIETGLSSDAAMNWMIGELESRAILSFSDAHSGAKLGREATVFETGETEKFGFEDLRKAIVGKSGASRLAYTIEFYPEEGKYHFSGHRSCGVRFSPQETKKLGTLCPVCGRPQTLGVAYRVEQLSRLHPAETTLPIVETVKDGVKWIKKGSHPPYVMLVPLMEILAQSLKASVSSKSVLLEYKKLTDVFGNELAVLMKIPLEELARTTLPGVVEGIRKVRLGEIFVEPGYDGVYGQVRLIAPEENPPSKTQMSFF